ncbi:MAG: imidazole glycerol phosphate synthase subunit HisH [Bacteroidetes bacterium]|nr:imidazole glycerol phosphate synthase subunit HisH [Bacteroidota bacterium]MCB0852007.1 imidazole glycerol phosphate synthase subunit HisH [Bacteroidota bacterium]
MITIIDYGLGNLASIKNMLKRIGVKSIITDDPETIAAAEKLILPGVGAFEMGMNYIREKGLLDVMNQRVLEDKIPVLGICLGMQLLSRHSEEGDAEGLGWIEGDTIKFDFEPSKNLKIPHMGWSEISQEHSSQLMHEMYEDPRFYFVHSYHVVCDDPEDVLLSVDYGMKVTCGVEKGNIMGVQFHPEKSHKFGMKLLSNFANNY